MFQSFPTHWLSTSLGKQFLWLKTHIPQYTFSLVSLVLVFQEKRLKNFWSSGFLIPRSISLIKSSRVCTRELVSVKSLGLASWAITTGEASSLTTVSWLEKNYGWAVGVSGAYNNTGFCPPDSLSQIFTQKKLFTYCVFDNEFKRWCPCIEWKDHCKYFREMSDQNCQISSDGFASHVTSGHDLFNLSIETRPLQMFLPRQTGWDQQMSYNLGLWSLGDASAILHDHRGLCRPWPPRRWLEICFKTQKSHRNQKKLETKGNSMADAFSFPEKSMTSTSRQDISLRFMCLFTSQLQFLWVSLVGLSSSRFLKAICIHVRSKNDRQVLTWTIISWIQTSWMQNHQRQLVRDVGKGSKLFHGGFSWNTFRGTRIHMHPYTSSGEIDI